MGHTSSEIHSNRSLGQRKEALEGFKIGRYRVLIATDIAARGIDVTGIELVVNYDLPENPEDYVHRIGRTARAGMSGKAVSFATPDQRYDVRSIERLIKITLPVKQTPGNMPTIARSTLPDRPAYQARRESPARHGYVREQGARNSSNPPRPGFRKPARYKSHDQFPRPVAGRPQDQGFDANRIRYRDDRNSY
jgi:ATP-dependent RNA helicase RhlE